MEQDTRKIGNLTLAADSVLQSLTNGNPLPRRLSRLLRALLDAKGQTVPKEKLLDDAWGKGAAANKASPGR